MNDTPVVHLPWSKWQEITARLDRHEALLLYVAREAHLRGGFVVREEIAPLIEAARGDAP